MKNKVTVQGSKYEKGKTWNMETKVNNQPCEPVCVCCIYGVSNDVMRDRWLQSVMSPGKDYGKWSPGWCNRQCGSRVIEKGERPIVAIGRKATDRIRDTNNVWIWNQNGRFCFKTGMTVCNKYLNLKGTRADCFCQWQVFI